MTFDNVQAEDERSKDNGLKYSIFDCIDVKMANISTGISSEAD